MLVLCSQGYSSVNSSQMPMSHWSFSNRYTCVVFQPAFWLYGTSITCDIVKKAMPVQEKKKRKG